MIFNSILLRRRQRGAPAAGSAEERPPALERAGLLNGIMLWR
jgi:hypothetical protein